MASTEDSTDEPISKRLEMMQIQPSAEIAALDEEIKTRFSKRTGTIGKFLMEWIKLDESQSKLFQAKGQRGESYFQYTLAKNDLELGLALAEMAKFFAETEKAEDIEAWLNNTDDSKNDIWHYLAVSLAANEDESALTIAKILIQLEIDFCRKNDEDESALSNLLLPEVKWKSINSMNMAKELTIEDIESAFSQHIHSNEQVKQEIIFNIFSSDLDVNDGQLYGTILRQSVTSAAEREQKERAFKLFFEYVGGPRRDTIFGKLIETSHDKLFESTLNLLIEHAEYRTRELAARDINAARNQQQIIYYNILSRRNRPGQNLLMKAVIADKPKIVATFATGLLKNESMVSVSKDKKGQTQKNVMTVDEKSPAPQNPALSLLLQQDARGNTVYHTAVLLSRIDCNKRLYTGLSLMDSYMVATRIPNKYGLSVGDCLDPKTGRQKLGLALKKGKLQAKDAQQLSTLLQRINLEIREFLGDLIKRSKETFERTGGLSEAKPTFDLKRIPTVSEELHERLKAKAAQQKARKAAQG